MIIALVLWLVPLLILLWIAASLNDVRRELGRIANAVERRQQAPDAPPRSTPDS